MSSRFIKKSLYKEEDQKYLQLRIIFFSSSEERRRHQRKDEISSTSDESGEDSQTPLHSIRPFIHPSLLVGGSFAPSCHQIADK